jgi:tripartite-type tricarboxylate transporter receptor subunit TctC
MRKTWIAMAGAVLSLYAVAPATAQTAPARIIVALIPGGAVDIAARAISERLGCESGWGPALPHLRLQSSRASWPLIQRSGES